jgi:hypothetical protein
MTTQTPGTDVRGRRTVATFTEYRKAERAVDHLSDQGFPVERTAIVGQGLELVEQVTGRLDKGRATLIGAAQGAFIGSLFGWLIVAFNWADAVVGAGWLIVDMFLIGSIAGAILGFATHAMTRGRRDFASVPLMRAERYQLVVDEAFADEAAALLRGLDEGSAATGGSTRRFERADDSAA